MGTSGRVRLRDISRGDRLIHDCRDLGGDPSAWSEILVGGLAGLVGGRVVHFNEIGLADPERPKLRRISGHGWESADHLAHWDERYPRDHPFRQAESTQRFMKTMRPGLTTRTREQFVDDPAWYRSFEYNEVHSRLGLDDLLISYVRSEPRRGMLGFTIVRPRGEGKFSTRSRRLARLFHRQLSGHLGTTLRLEPLAPTPLDGLPPQLGRTLALILEGLPEKRIAALLGLSPHTVHEYAGKLHERLGVHSRAELFAACYKVDPAIRARVLPDVSALIGQAGPPVVGPD